MTKNILLLYARLYVNGADLSGDSRSLSEIRSGMDQVPVSGWSEQIRKYKASQVMSTGLFGYQAFMNDDAGGAFTVLKDSPSIVATMLFGEGAAPAIGGLAYLLAGVSFTATSQYDQQSATLRADLVPGVNAVTDGKPWGRVLQHAVALTATTTSASVDNGVASADGYQANLHVIAKGTGDVEWAFEIEHSDNGSDWSTLVSFSLDGDTLTAEHKSGTGTVERYTRLVSTRTDGSVTVVCALSRN